MSSRPNTEELAKKVYAENEDALNELLKSFLCAIDLDQMPKADEILNKKSRNAKNNIPRPPNSNIIYTNLLNNFGLLGIIRKFCEKHGINKQSLIPISKKLSKILWNKISDEHRKFFDELAAEVSSEHKKMYPDYKYKPKRKDRKGTIIQYKPTTETDNEKPIHHQPVDISMAQNSHVDKTDETSISANDTNDDEQMNDALTYDSQEECTSDESDGDDNFPTFVEGRPSTPLQFPQNDHFSYNSNDF
jgi:hypothetical protein